MVRTLWYRYIYVNSTPASVNYRSFVTVTSGVKATLIENVSATVSRIRGTGEKATVGRVASSSFAVGTYGTKAGLPARNELVWPRTACHA